MEIGSLIQWRDGIILSMSSSTTTPARGYIIKRIQELEQQRQERLHEFKRLETQRNELNKQGILII